MNNVNLNTQICSHRSSLAQFALKFTQNLNDADDLVQDTMLKAIRYADNYQEGTNLKGWLFTIMKNTFINNYRKLTMVNALVTTSEELSSFQLIGSASSNGSENKFIQHDVNKALSTLQPEYYIPFIKYFEGFKYHEIAEELAIPIGTVKTRIHVARKLLKANLKMYKQDFGKNIEVN